VPSAFLKRRPDGAIFEIEGALPDAGGLVGCRASEGAIAALLLGLTGAARGGHYLESSSIVTIEGDGRGHVYPPAERRPVARVVPEETAFSAWDSLVEVLGPEESALIDMPDADGPLRASASLAPGPKLIELGVPELHVLKITGPRERYIELTGDAPRVFDGVL
jgi:hypothetical protein